MIKHIDGKKACSQCKIEKELCRYDKDHRSSDRLQSSCKECNKKYTIISRARKQGITVEELLFRAEQRKKLSDGGHKKCNDCLEVLDVSNFSIMKTYKGKLIYYPNCKKCSVIDVKKRRLKKFGNETLYNRWIHLKNRYGIQTLEEYEKLIENGCYLCFSKTRLHIDHNHKTNKIRGVLCINCNVGLGNFKDSIELLQKAIRYLENDN